MQLQEEVMRNGRIVLKSLADLGQFADLIASPAVRDDPPAVAVVPASTDSLAGADLEALAAALGTAAEELRAIAEADARAREEAASAVATFRRLEELVARLDALITGAEMTATRADGLVANALDEGCRKRAEQVKTVATTLAGSARHRLEATRAHAEVLRERRDVRQVLAEEARMAEAAAREAEERQRQDALRCGLVQVEALITEGNENEARRLLGRLAKEHPNSPEPASYVATLERRAQAVKCDATEHALRQARPLVRRAPDEALALLHPLDLDGLPDPLVRQVYGCWLAACRRLSLSGAHLYSPRFGRGAVLVPADDGRLAVVTAIGLPDWTHGRRFAAAALRGARAL